MKNIGKFILRMVVTACIVVGVIAIVMNLTNKSDSKLAIADKSVNLNISTKLDNSHKDIVSIVEDNNQNDFSGKVSATVINALVQINEVLEEYYDHYIVLTSFEHKADENLKNSVLQQISKLNSKIDTTTKYLNQVTSANESNYTERNSRIINHFNALCEQTTTLFETCSYLKSYVYTVNYQTEVCTSKTEAVLEMAKDYSKVVFDAEIKNNVLQTTVLSMLYDTSLSSFKVVIPKTLDITAETNSETEIDFTYHYFDIDKKYLNEFFKLNSSQKSSYVGELNNFLEEAPEQETEEQSSQRYQRAREQQQYMVDLLYFMSQASY